MTQRCQIKQCMLTLNFSNSEENTMAFDLSEKRLHHEIYLSDPRKSSQDKNRCVIRYPIKKNQEEMVN